MQMFIQETGVTPLMLAARENRLVIAERLIDHGSNVNDIAKVCDIITGFQLCVTCITMTFVYTH